MLEGQANELGLFSQINSNVTVCLIVWLSNCEMLDYIEPWQWLHLHIKKNPLYTLNTTISCSVSRQRNPHTSIKMFEYILDVFKKCMHC